MGDKIDRKINQGLAETKKSIDQLNRQLTRLVNAVEIQAKTADRLVANVEKKYLKKNPGVRCNRLIYVLCSLRK